MGNISLVGATSGATTLQPQSTGTYTVTLPAGTGTLSLTANPTFTGVTTESTITSPAATALTIQSAGTTAMTIDTSQNVLIGTTASSSPSQGLNLITGTGAYYAAGHASGTASGTGYSYFLYNSTIIGSITQNGTTAVAFNTSSDYRLKENVTPMTTGLATIGALKPVTYDWISDKSKGEGFIAHELQEIIPLAVTGEKDAVDENGNPRHQGVDYSKIVVHLVAAVQELTARIAALEAK